MLLIFQRQHFTITLHNKSTIKESALRKILIFHLNSWCANFVEMHSFHRVQGGYTRTLRKLFVFTKLPHQEIRWFLGILRSAFWSIYNLQLSLTLSWRRALSYKNQSIDFVCKSVDCFLYERDLRHERNSIITVRLGISEYFSQELSCRIPIDECF